MDSNSGPLTFSLDFVNTTVFIAVKLALELGTNKLEVSLS